MSEIFRPASQLERNTKQRDFQVTNADEEYDCEFVTHVRRRTKRFYVGGSFLERKIINYASRWGVQLTWVNITSI